MKVSQKYFNGYLGSKVCNAVSRVRIRRVSQEQAEGDDAGMWREDSTEPFNPSHLLPTAWHNITQTLSQVWRSGAERTWRWVSDSGCVEELLRLFLVQEWVTSSEPGVPTPGELTSMSWPTILWEWPWSGWMNINICILQDLLAGTNHSRTDLASMEMWPAGSCYETNWNVTTFNGILITWLSPCLNTR